MLFHDKKITNAFKRLKRGPAVHLFTDRSKSESPDIYALDGRSNHKAPKQLEVVIPPDTPKSNQDSF